MPFCPKCKKSYPDSIKECPTDRVVLVGELPFQSMEGEGTTWVEITSTGTDEEARIITGFLEAEGIPAHIENVKFSMEPINFGTMGDIRVYVEAQNEEQAQQLMRQRNTAFERLEDDADTIVTDEGVAEITEDEEIEPTEN